MDRVTVVSSNLVSVGYDPGSRTLEVEFWGGRIYQYFNVPSIMHRQLMSARSKGRYLARAIKPAYDFRRVA
ncbi:KTSC domain-containing protein [Actinocrinis sp.]|jgi:hypothetical protein|uniref:KTSC domain-containing protein n=1 Tax=Actinocrinis sp. TaxID=1920516 RepID=UPI0032C217CD